MSWPVWYGSGGLGSPASPAETYSIPSGPNFRHDPMCPPACQSSSSTSLAPSIRGGSVGVTVNRETRCPFGRFFPNFLCSIM